MYEYPANRGYDEPNFITTGPDGTLWFISIYDGYYPYLAQIPTSGAFPSYYNAGSWPNALTSGPDGSIWIGNWYLASDTIEQVIPIARRNGVDLSAFSPLPPPLILTQFQEAGVKYAVIEGSQQGLSRPLELLTAFSEAGFKTAAYCYLYFSQTAPTGDQQAQSCFNSISGALSTLSFVALDVEDLTQPRVADPVGLINSAVQTLSNDGVKNIVIYTNQGYWYTLTNNTTQFSSHPLWNAAHDSFTAYADPAGNLSCAPDAQAKIKRLTPTAHGGTGMPSLTAPATISAFSITNNVVTFTAVNTFLAGQKVAISGLSAGTFLNGKRLTVLATGLAGSQFAANFVHSDVAYTSGITGKASLVLFGGWASQAGTQYDIGRSGACLFGMNVDFDVFDPSLFGPDFAISATPNSLVLPQGTQAMTTLTVTPVEAFNQSVTLSAPACHSNPHVRSRRIQ